MHNVYNAKILLEAGVPPQTSLRELMMLFFFFFFFQ